MLGLLLSAGIVGAPVKVVGDWGIYRQTPTSCLMGTRDAQRGTAFLVAVDSSRPKMVVLAVGDAAWTSLTEGSSKPIQYFGNSSLFTTGKPLGYSLNGQMFLAAPAPGWEVDKAFQNSMSLSAIFEGTVLFRRYSTDYDLAAFEATRQCAGLSNDPFAAR